MTYVICKLLISDWNETAAIFIKSYCLVELRLGVEAECHNMIFKGGLSVRDAHQRRICLFYPGWPCSVFTTCSQDYDAVREHLLVQLTTIDKKLPLALSLSCQQS